MKIIKDSSCGEHIKNWKSFLLTGSEIIVTKMHVLSGKQLVS